MIKQFLAKHGPYSGIRIFLAIILPLFGWLGAPYANFGKVHRRWTSIGFLIWPIVVLYALTAFALWRIDENPIALFFIRLAWNFWFLTIPATVVFVASYGYMVAWTVRQVTGQARLKRRDWLAAGNSLPLTDALKRVELSAWTPAIGGLGYSWRKAGFFGIGWLFMILGWICLLFTSFSRFPDFWHTFWGIPLSRFLRRMEASGDPFALFLHIYLFAWIALFLVELIRYLAWKKNPGKTEETTDATNNEKVT